MSFRLVLGAVLAISTCGLHAQSPIRPIMDGCFAKHGNNQQATKECIGSAWAGSLKQVAQDAGQQADQRCVSRERTNFQQQVGKLQGDFQHQIGSCKAQLEQAKGKPAPDMAAALASARSEERERIRTRRLGGIDAIKVFLYEFNANSKNLDREVELVTETGLAGTILVRRKSGSAAILLPFPSLARAELQEGDTRLYFECRPEIKDCVTFVQRDGGIKVHSSVVFAISPTQADIVRQRASAAIQAFSD